MTLTLRDQQDDLPITAAGLLGLVLVWVGGGLLVPRLAVQLIWRLHRRWYR